MAGSFALASTKYYDQSKNQNLQVDLSSGDLSSGANRNIVAGGNVSYQGLTDELANNVIGAVKDAYTGATNFIKDAIAQADNRTESTVESMTKNFENATQSIKEAYSSEKSTLESFKSYAIYGLIAFVAWAYFRK